MESSELECQWAACLFTVEKQGHGVVSPGLFVSEAHLFPEMVLSEFLGSRSAGTVPPSSKSGPRSEP